jgi:undecaprenyl-diphosphatase
MRFNMGALASAATELPLCERSAVWALSGALVLTRVVLLAHWVSDVAVGFAVGIGLERTLRVVTGYGYQRVSEQVVTAVPEQRSFRSAKAS